MGAIEPVDIGGVVIGDGYPVVFMAETSTFFNKDVDLAMSYVKAAVDAGVRIFKSEVLHDPEVCLRDTGLTFAYNHAAGSHTEGWRQIIERKVIPLEGYRRIYDYCRELGVPFVASVYDIEGIDFLVEAGAGRCQDSARQHQQRAADSLRGSYGSPDDLRRRSRVLL